MIRKAETLAMTLLLVAAYCSLALGQVPPPTILLIDLENVVNYQQDISDPSKFATNPNVTPPAGHNNFSSTRILGDIVAVNGQPARGLFADGHWVIGTSPVPRPGSAIADVTHDAIREQIFEILKSDGTPVGSIMALGFSSGPAPPGAPLVQPAGNWAIVGGTGAFLGARGQEGGFGNPPINPPRTASIAEDPANRRTNGGGTFRYILHVIPMSVPQIVTTTSGPAVTHSSDFSLVTASKPAAAGEILSLFATGLGPTVPGVDPGQPFPASPPAVVNSPVDVTVNGKPAEVLAAVGVPGAVDGYQVNFQVPPDAAKGPATIQLRAAWIAGPEVKTVIQ